MAQIQSIQALAELHAQEVSRSPRDWMGYLDTAARLYRYSFQENLLIHAQRPGATACAELELWNSKMNRWVNRGAKGIALLDDTGPRLRLRYVFPIPIRSKGQETPTCGKCGKRTMTPFFPTWQTPMAWTNRQIPCRWP